jgi:hypothetical protein
MLKLIGSGFLTSSPKTHASVISPPNFNDGWFSYPEKSSRSIGAIVITLRVILLR